MLSLFAAVLIQATNGVPFTAALDQVAAERARDQKAEIVLEIGVKGFALLKPIYIDRELQPTGAGKLTVRGAKGMRPRIFGSVPVKNWKRVGKKMNGRSDVWVADVSALDPVDQLDALFLDGAMMTLARYPNFNPKMPYSGGWAYVPGRWVSMYHFPKPEPAGGRTEMRVGKKDWHNWAVPSEGRIVIFPRQRYGSLHPQRLPRGAGRLRRVVPRPEGEEGILHPAEGKGSQQVPCHRSVGQLDILS